jgi:hypothetical protein
MPRAYAGATRGNSTWMTSTTFATSPSGPPPPAGSTANAFSGRRWRTWGSSKGLNIYKLPATPITSIEIQSIQEAPADTKFSYSCTRTTKYLNLVQLCVY